MGAVMLGGGRLSEAFSAASHGKVEAAIVLENDLYRRAPAARVDAVPGRRRLQHSARPSGNEDGAGRPRGVTGRDLRRGDRHLCKPRGPGSALLRRHGAPGRSARVVALAGDARGRSRAPERSWAALDDLLAALADELPEFASLLEAAPPAGFRLDGMKIPRQPKRYSGRTAMNAPHPLLEPPPKDDVDSPLAFSMEGSEEQPPAAAIGRLLGARLELDPGAQQVPGRGRRPAARRRDGPPPAGAVGRRGCGPAAAIRRAASLLRAPRRVARGAAAPRLRLGGAECAGSAGGRTCAGALCGALRGRRRVARRADTRARAQRRLDSGPRAARAAIVAARRRRPGRRAAGPAGADATSRARINRLQARRTCPPRASPEAGDA